MNNTVRTIVILAVFVSAGIMIAVKQKCSCSGTCESETPADKAVVPDSTPAADPAAQPVAALPRLVDLGSDKCIPCKMMEPVLEELKTEYAGRMEVVFINTRIEPAKAELYGIKLIPTQIFFDAAGSELFRHEGFFSKEEIIAKWSELGVSFETQEK